MIKIAIDIDGTITHNPNYFKHLIIGQMAYERSLNKKEELCTQM